MTVTVAVGDDAVAVVTLDRPEARNALDAGMFAALRDAADEIVAAAADGRCRAALLRGAGPVFCAGIDLGWLAAQADGAPPDDATIARLQDAFTVYEDLPVPTVAAVHGAALGAGCQLALATTFRVAAPDARLALAEARWGLVPDLGATWRLPRLVGLSRAVDMVATAREVDAATALSWGLVDAVLDDADDDFPRAARTYAARLAAGPTAAMVGVAALLRQSFGRDRVSALAAERRLQQACLRSADFAEAVAAARQGRKAAFRRA